MTPNGGGEWTSSQSTHYPLTQVLAPATRPQGFLFLNKVGALPCRFQRMLRRVENGWGVFRSCSLHEALACTEGLHRTYVGRLERGESGVTVEALATILAALGVSLGDFFAPFNRVVKPRTPSRGFSRGRSADSHNLAPTA